MLFNSYTFWIFFLLVYVAYRLLPFRGQNWMLLGASYIFYGWWDWRFLGLLMLSTMLDYVSGICIERGKSPHFRKVFLVLSIVANLTFLGFFKYYGFFSKELMTFLEGFGIHVSMPSLNVILPIGISFYTFQSMAYVIDVYRGQAQAVKNLPLYALYVAYFPQLVAGPIQRYHHLFPQLANPRQHHTNDFTEGLYHVLMGLFKKVVIADNMASIANAIFNAAPGNLSGAEVLVGVYAFAFQIYGDFSGYSSIAQGVSKWLGIDLVYNFNMPYFATNPSDFWQRWHITLSRWLRDYLYIPLGGNRHGTVKTYRNLMLTMVLGGLWHGANWTYLAWGFLHGLMLCIYRPFEKSKKDRPPTAPTFWGKFLAGLLMFHLVCLSWLLFRAQTMEQVWAMLGQLITNFHMTPFAWHCIAAVLFFCMPLMVLEWWINRKGDLVYLTKINWFPRGLAYSYFVLMLWFFPSEIAHEFIYFQF